MDVLDMIAVATPVTACCIRLANLRTVIGKPPMCPGLSFLNGWICYPAIRHSSRGAYFIFFRHGLPVQAQNKLKNGLQHHQSQVHRSANRRYPTLPPRFFFGLCLTEIFVFRFFIEFLKEDQVDFESAMTLNMGQWLSIPFILIGVYIYVFPRQENGRKIRTRNTKYQGMKPTVPPKETKVPCLWYFVPLRETKSFSGNKPSLRRNFCFILWNPTYVAGYFPLTIRLMSFSLFSASSGVRLFTSRFSISSRIWYNTGSSSWKKLRAACRRAFSHFNHRFGRDALLAVVLSSCSNISPARFTILLGIPAILATWIPKNAPRRRAQFAQENDLIVDFLHRYIISSDALEGFLHSVQFMVVRGKERTRLGMRMFVDISTMAQAMEMPSVEVPRPNSSKSTRLRGERLFRMSAACSSPP